MDAEERVWQRTCFHRVAASTFLPSGKPQSVAPELAASTAESIGAGATRALPNIPSTSRCIRDCRVDVAARFHAQPPLESSRESMARGAVAIVAAAPTNASSTDAAAFSPPPPFRKEGEGGG